MIVLDTTVLVYAVGDDHALRSPAQAIVSAVETGTIQATTTVEVIQEFVHVRARRRDRADAAAIGGAFATLLSPLLQSSETDLSEGLRLFERTEALGAFDAVLAATAMASGADGLVSTDRTFGSVRGLRWLNLATDDLQTMIGLS